MRPRRLLFLTAVTATAAGCGIVAPNGHVWHGHTNGDIVEGSGRIVSETRAVPAVAALEIEGRRRLDLEIDVQVGPAPLIQIQADDNLLPHIHANAHAGTLRIYSDRNLRGTQPVRIRYTAPRLERIETAGRATTRVSGLAGGTLHVVQRGSGKIALSGSVDRLEAVNSGSGSLLADTLATAATRVALNGSGGVSLGSIQGDELQAQLYGSGSLTARGAVERAEVTVHGSGDAHLAALRCGSADLVTNGSGDIAITVSGRVATHTNGSGGITVHGAPPERSIAGKRTTFMH